MSTDPDTTRFREHLTLEQCKALLRYGHVIPISRGYTTAYVDEHFPGWTWNQLIRVFIAAGIYINRGGAPPTCDDRVRTFHFSSPIDFHVEWIDGSEPPDVAAKREANDLSTGNWAIDAGDGVMIATLGDVDIDDVETD